MPSCNPAAFSDAPRSFRDHFYETADPMEAVSAPGYFAPAAALLAPGDVIRVRAGTGGRIAYREFVVVRVRRRTGEVTVAPLATVSPPSGSRTGRPVQATRQER